jgi:hypothetical protein
MNYSAERIGFPAWFLDRRSSSNPDVCSVKLPFQKGGAAFAPTFVLRRTNEWKNACDTDTGIPIAVWNVATNFIWVGAGRTRD